MSQVRTAAIIGVHWGLVHLRGLREAGCDVVALAALDGDKARAAAAREAVPRGTTDIASLNDVDVVVVATPAATHRTVLGQLPDPFLICEKPLIGARGAIADLPDTTGRMFVNYAFPFLQTARTVAGLVDRIGPPQAIRLDVVVGLPLPFSSVEWFLEAASHPLSWLLHLFGMPTVQSRQIGPDSLQVQLVAGQTPITVGLQIGGTQGISHRVACRWSGHQALAAGRFRPGQLWQYDPVLLDGAAVNAGEWSQSDCWLDANAASVGSMIAVFRGARSWTDGIAGGLFDAERALWVERVIRDDL